MCSLSLALTATSLYIIAQLALVRAAIHELELALSDVDRKR